ADEGDEEAAKDPKEAAGDGGHQAKKVERGLAAKDVEGNEGRGVDLDDEEDEEQAETARQHAADERIPCRDWGRGRLDTHQGGHDKDCLSHKERGWAYRKVPEKS